jgi:hypothetical protein
MLSVIHRKQKTKKEKIEEQRLRSAADKLSGREV